MDYYCSFLAHPLHNQNLLYQFWVKADKSGETQTDRRRQRDGDKKTDGQSERQTERQTKTETHTYRDKNQ